MEFQQQQYTIDQLVQKVRAGRLALPDFQREFVWNPIQVVELLDSVSRQWPIGSLLLLSGPQPFAVRSLDSGPEIADAQLDLYILDGQQRVTSLFHAVADESDFCYYIDFDALSRDEDEYICWERRPTFQSIYPTIDARAGAHIALIQDIWELKSFYEWLECLPESAQKTDFVFLRESKLPGLVAKVYKVMAIVLEQSIALEALSRIFETLNRTGVALNAFDLMVAALYPSGFHLRDEWDAIRDRYPRIASMDPDGLEPLKLIALMVRARLGKKASRGVRQGDLLSLDRRHFRDSWSEATALYDRALRYCQENFGVITSQVVPSWSMILGVAGWLLRDNQDDNAIREWWNQRVLIQHFAQAANTRVVADFDSITAFKPESPFWEAPEVDSDTLDKPAKANGVLLRGLAALLINNGAIDPFDKRPLAEIPRVMFRALSRDGELRRPRGGDLLCGIVLVSEDTDIKLGKSYALSNLPAYRDALVSQGIDIDRLQRSVEFTKQLFESGNRGMTQ